MDVIFSVTLKRVAVHELHVDWTANSVFSRYRFFISENIVHVSRRVRTFPDVFYNCLNYTVRQTGRYSNKFFFSVLDRYHGDTGSENTEMSVPGDVS